MWNILINYKRLYLIISLPFQYNNNSKTLLMHIFHEYERRPFRNTFALRCTRFGYLLLTMVALVLSVGARDSTNPIEVNQATSTNATGWKEKVDSDFLTDRDYTLQEFSVEVSSGLATGFELKFIDDLGVFPAGQSFLIGTSHYE